MKAHQLPREAIDLIGFGEVMVLLQPDPPETLTDASLLRIHVAGAEFNACAAAAALGARTAMVTRVGVDPLAERIRQHAERCGVELLAAQDASAPTGLFMKDPLADGERHVYYYRAGSAASRMGLDDARRGLAERPRAVLLSGLTAALGGEPARMIAKVAEQAFDLGVAVILDTNLRPRLGRLAESIEAIERILPFASIVATGIADGEILFGTSNPESIAREARARGATEVVVTGGAAGSWWQATDATMHFQSNLAELVVDTVGAGDAFVGSYAAARLAGLSPSRSAWLGSAVAARVIATPGDTAGLPSVDEAAALLASVRSKRGFTS